MSNATSHYTFHVSMGLLVLSIALILRVLSGWNDLWFDEICSIELAHQMNSWRGIFDEFRYDINHYLNTLWVYVIGSGRNELLYRAPAILAGVATVPVTWWTVRPYGRTSQIVAALLTAFSYAQIHYSTEARGYSLQILFAIAAFGCLDRFHRTARMPWAIGFSVSATMALLAHLLTLNLLLACGYWTISFQLGQNLGWRQQWGRIASCLGLPFVFSIGLYLLHVRFLEFGGGPKYSTFLVTTSAWGLVLGITQPGPLRIGAGILAILLSIIALKRHWQFEPHESSASENWKFFFVLLFVIPLARICIPSSILFTRYFLLQITFVLILLSIVAGQVAGDTAHRKWLWGFVLMFVALNIGQTSRLIGYGRGQYQASLIRMGEQQENGPSKVAFSNRQLNEPVVNYFVRRPAMGGRNLSFCQPSERPDWFVIHETMDCAARVDVPPQHISVYGDRYRLEFISDTSYLSGFRWCCYRRAERIARVENTRRLDGTFEPRPR